MRRRSSTEIFAEILSLELQKDFHRIFSMSYRFFWDRITPGIKIDGRGIYCRITINKAIVENIYKIEIDALVWQLIDFIEKRFYIRIDSDDEGQVYYGQREVLIDIKGGDDDEFNEVMARILGLSWQVEPPDAKDIAWAKKKAIKRYEHSNMLTSEIQKGHYNFDSFFGLGALDGLSQQEQKAYKSLIQDFVDEIAKVRNLYAMTFGINKNIDYDFEELEKIARIVDDLADKYKSKGIKIMVVPDKLNPSDNVNTHVRITFPNARYTFDVQHVLPQVAASMGVKKPQPNFGANAALSPETRKNLEALKKYTNNKSFGFEQAVHTIPGGHFATNGHMFVFIADKSAKEYISDGPMDDHTKANLLDIVLPLGDYTGTLLDLKNMELFFTVPTPPHQAYVTKFGYGIFINGFAIYLSRATLKLLIKSIKEFIVKRAPKSPVYIYAGEKRLIATTVPPNVNIIEALKSKKHDFALMTSATGMQKDEYITYDTISNTITTADATGLVDIYDSQFNIPAKVVKHATAKLAAMKSGLILRKK